MRITYSNSDTPKKLARTFAGWFECHLSQAQECIAILSGYETWDALMSCVNQLVHREQTRDVEWNECLYTTAIRKIGAKKLIPEPRNFFQLYSFIFQFMVFPSQLGMNDTPLKQFTTFQTCLQRNLGLNILRPQKEPPVIFPFEARYFTFMPVLFTRGDDIAVAQNTVRMMSELLEPIESMKSTDDSHIHNRILIMLRGTLEAISDETFHASRTETITSIIAKLSLPKLWHLHNSRKNPALRTYLESIGVDIKRKKQDDTPKLRHAYLIECLRTQIVPIYKDYFPDTALFL